MNLTLIRPQTGEVIANPTGFNDNWIAHVNPVPDEKGRWQVTTASGDTFWVVATSKPGIWYDYLGEGART